MICINWLKKKTSPSSALSSAASKPCLLCRVKIHIAIDPFQLKSAADEKVKLAHDLGHCVQGAFYNQYSPVDIVERSEYKANKWAIEQLVPEEELRKACAEGETTIFELSEHFGVTEQFMRLACDFYANVSEMK